MEEMESAVLKQRLFRFRRVGGKQFPIDRQGGNPFPEGDAKGRAVTPRALAQPHQEMAVKRALAQQAHYGVFKGLGHGGRYPASPLIALIASSTTRS